MTVPGTNKCASQKGMSMGSVRHVADIKADDLVREGQGHISLQAGTNQCASQKGMSMGSVRHVSDIKADDCVREGMDYIGLQAGLLGLMSVALIAAVVEFSLAG